MLYKLIRTYLCFLLLSSVHSTYAQFSFYTVNGVHLSVHENCSTTQKIPSKGTNSIAGTISIAITAEGKLYGIEENTLFQLNKTDGSVDSIGNLHNKDGIAIFGNSLVGLDNSTLLTLHQDTLYSIDIKSGLATFMGKTNHFSGGDLAFFEDKLYLASNYNHLIEITLSSDKSSIESVIDIGEMNVKHAFSLCTIYENCESKALHVINGNGLLYKINVVTAEAEFICDFDMITYDAASFHDFVPARSPIKNIHYPNVFTPNSDGMNDHYIIHDSLKFNSFKIYDRWGQLIYQIKSGPVNWNGTTMDGNEAQEGLYYYSAEIENETKALISAQDSITTLCPSSSLILNHGAITLIR